MGQIYLIFMENNATLKGQYELFDIILPYEEWFCGTRRTK